MVRFGEKGRCKPAFFISDSQQIIPFKVYIFLPDPAVALVESLKFTKISLLFLTIPVI